MVFLTVAMFFLLKRKSNPQIRALWVSRAATSIYGPSFNEASCANAFSDGLGTQAQSCPFCRTGLAMILTEGILIKASRATLTGRSSKVLKNKFRKFSGKQNIKFKTCIKCADAPVHQMRGRRLGRGCSVSHILWPMEIYPRNLEPVFGHTLAHFFSNIITVAWLAPVLSNAKVP